MKNPTGMAARDGMVQAAQFLFGVGWDGVTQIRKAWEAVGIVDPPPPME